MDVNSISSRETSRESEYRAFFQDVHPDATRFALRRAEAAIAEEAVGDAMLVAWRRFDEAPPDPGDRRAWLFGIVRNTLLNARRSQLRQHSLAVRLAGAVDVGLDPAGAVGIRADIRVAWERLTAAQQEVLTLVILDDLTAEQAGRVLGVTAATVRTRVVRARRVLQRMLPDHRPIPSRFEEKEAQ
jgi:RNA polymerase sigma-70 factor (ECF subfamily)